MTRKISAETRRRLKDASKARWAKEYAEQTAAPVAASQPIPPVVAALDIAQMELHATASVAPRGRTCPEEKRRFKLERVTGQSVTVEVNGKTAYLVTFELADGRINGFCECPDDDDWKEVICEHKVAAAIFLRE
jgi:uncharacterized Zn finger protein